MRRIQVRTICLLLVGFFCQSSHAQGGPPSPRAQNLRMAWVELQKKPDDSITQEEYLTVFPHDYKSFLKLFGLNRELYDDGYEYVAILPTLATRRERQVGTLLVQLCEDAQYDADAPSYLQHAMAAYGTQHTQMFVTLLKRLPPGKQAHVIAFLADVENPTAYPEYQSIIDRLKMLGDSDVARKFEIAREKRSRSHG